MEVDELQDAGDQVLASTTNHGRGKQSGAEASWKTWTVWTLRNGKVIRGQAFTSRAEALEAVAPRE